MLLVRAAAVAALTVHVVAAAGRGDAPLAMQDLLSARWPSRAAWSPDGQYISFLSTDWVAQDFYAVAADGGTPIALTTADGFVGGTSWDRTDPFGSWSQDGRRLAFNAQGTIVVAAIPGGHTTRVGRASPGSDVRFSPVDDRLAFVLDGDLVIADTSAGTQRTLTTQGHFGASIAWSPDGRLLAMSVIQGGRRASASPPFLGPLLTFNWSVRGTRRVAVVEAGSGTVRVLADSHQDEAAFDWSPDGRSLLTERRTLDAKERSIWLVDLENPSKNGVLYQQRDAKHVATNNQMAAFSPDGRSVLFTSDEDHWNHIFVEDVPGGRPRQLTRGAYEVSFPAWSRDGRTIYFASTEAGPAERQIFQVPASGGRARQLTSQPGINTQPRPAPSGNHLLFLHADSHRLPDYWTLDAGATPLPRQVTQSMSPSLRAERWQTPRLVTYPAKDGTIIHAQIFVPAGFDRTRKYPAIVQVHEASAINQDVFLGPGPQKDNVAWYGWHQRLAQRGYVVLNVDYRGSFGYGRDFRTADYLVLGEDPLEDVVAGVEFLDGAGYVDGSRVAIVGLSAGGRMVLSLLGKHPDTFKAGVDLAGIYDYLLPGGPWDTRNPWTRARLGTPDAEPRAYREASPRTVVEHIKSPLLILHGTADANVPITHSLALIQDLLRLGKVFEFEVYPGEVHFFSRRSSWVDALRRMETFFDRQLGVDRGDNRHD